MSGGVKFDQGKIRYDLIPPEVEQQLAQVLTMGAEKYGDRNWEEGIRFTKLWAALRRHVHAHQMGVEDDHESGLPHLSHALCNMAMMVAQQQRMMEQFDDLQGNSGICKECEAVTSRCQCEADTAEKLAAEIFDSPTEGGKSLHDFIHDTPPDDLSARDGGTPEAKTNSTTLMDEDEIEALMVGGTSLQVGMLLKVFGNMTYSEQQKVMVESRALVKPNPVTGGHNQC